jgi:protein SCO1/2
MRRREPGRRWPRPLLWGLLLAALVGVMFAAVRPWMRWPAGEQRRAVNLPVLGKVPDFRLVDRDGRGVALGDLAGAPWIADFIFTRCVASCPMLSARMARLDRALPAKISLVSFSVDPGWDTPAVLAQYAKAFAASRRWRFLTGGKEQIQRLSRQGFKLALEPGPGAAREAILHSTRFVLVDESGAIRGYYEALDPRALDRLAADARALARRR